MPQVFYKYGVCEDKNGRFRRTMEDTHVHVPNVRGVPGQGFFAIFDGHGGKKCADYCEENAFRTFLDVREEFTNLSIPEVLDKTFAVLDEGLKKENAPYSGCTSVVAFLEVHSPPKEEEKRSTLFTANCGDARAVLCRSGRAIRLTYDHKASDPLEQQRVNEAGGVIMNDRVNGTLAITRALGDLAMKQLIVSRPYTTETTITADDSLLILACDGVWDVFSDQEAVDMIKDIKDPQEACELLMNKSLEKGTTDNLTVAVIRFQMDYFMNPEVQEQPKKESNVEENGE